MKKRAILREVEALGRGLYVDEDGLAARVMALEGKLAALYAKQAEVGIGDGLNLHARLAEIEGRLAWLHERVDLLFARCEAMRGDITLDDAAAKRLTYAVGKFSARLDRLEHPKTPPRGRPRKPKPEPPNGASEEVAADRDLAKPGEAQ